MSPKTATSMRGIAVLALLCAAVAPALGQQPAQQQEQQQAEKQHTVRKGDTLWDLARFYLSDPFRWPLIYDANRTVVEDPHWIYPLEKLVIPGLRGEARLVPTAVADATDVGLSERSRFFAPAMVDTMRHTLITSENVQVPLVQPLEFLAAPWLSEQAALPRTATIIRPADPRVDSNRLAQRFHPREQLFLSTTGTSVGKNDRLLVVRLSRRLNGHGWVVEPQGILQVDSLGSNTAAATIINQFGDLKVGDLAIPLPAVPALPADNLTAVSGGPTGELIEFLVDQPLYGSGDYAFVNLGARQGVALGDELLAFIPRQRVEGNAGEVLPEQAIAKLRVIRVTDGTATVRVTRLHHSALERGLPVRIARKASSS